MLPPASVRAEASVGIILLLLLGRSLGRPFCCARPLMVIQIAYPVLAIVLAAMAVLAFAAISKIEEPGRHL